MVNRYAGAHASPSGRGDARPTAHQIIKDEALEGQKLADKTILITGASSGIGLTTAQALAVTGARLFLGVRDVPKAEKVLSTILQPGRVDLLQMDLSSFASIRNAAQGFLKESSQLHIFIGNAGVAFSAPDAKTSDGHHMEFGTNHLGHFLLFQLLKPSLLASCTPSFNSRVIMVSSSGHRTSKIRFDDYNFEKGDYDPWVAYGQAKTANIYMANEIDRRYGSKGLHANSLHPGAIWTEITRAMPPEMREGFKNMLEATPILKNEEQGAATTVWAAVAKGIEGKGGLYLEDCDVSTEVGTYDLTSTGLCPHTFDEAAEKRLWADSCKMVGIQDDA